jgi:hypothetical protein
MLVLGRPVKEGEPEDLSGCPRTVFGVKIMCGLISTINPRSFQKIGDFFMLSDMTVTKTHPHPTLPLKGRALNGL